MVIGKRQCCGENYLDSLRVLTLVLDNGQKQDFHVVRELAVPSVNDPLALARLALQLPARTCFWRHYERRALAKCAQAGADCGALPAQTHITYRDAYQGKAGYDITEYNFLTSCVNGDSKVHAHEEQLWRLRVSYDRIKTVADAVEHLLFIIQRLLKGEKANERA